VKEVVRYEPPSISNPYATDTTPSVPPEMELLWIWEKYGTPPVEGGVLAQPFILMRCFNIIHNEQSAWAKIQRANKLAKLKWNKDKQGDG